MAIIIAKDNTILNCDNVASIVQGDSDTKYIVSYEANGSAAKEIEFERSPSLTAALLYTKANKQEAKGEELEVVAKGAIAPSLNKAVAAGNGAGGEVKIVGRGYVPSKVTESN